MPRPSAAEQAHNHSHDHPHDHLHDRAHDHAHDHAHGHDRGDAHGSQNRSAAAQEHTVTIPADESTALLGDSSTAGAAAGAGAERGAVAAGAAGNETRTLAIACALTTAFFLIELFGGYVAGSLAIMSDAAHLLSDLAGLLISLIAVSAARIPASKLMSFGYARAEVIGAFMSLIFIWAITAVLTVSAVYRLFNPAPVRGPLMLALGAIGLAVNVALGCVLGHSHHSHAHCPAHDHDHAHGHGPDHDHDHAHGHSHAHGDGGSHGEGEGRGSWDWSLLLGSDIESLNVRAAYLHVLGDLLQSVGVLVAAAVLTVWPSLTFVDPLCTLVFAGLVLLTTKGLAAQTLGVLMEGSPAGTSVSAVSERLLAIPGVLRVGDFHVWSISVNRPALSVHLVTDAPTSDHGVLKQAQTMLRDEFRIDHSTIQINCEEKACCDDDLSRSPGEECLSLPV